MKKENNEDTTTVITIDSEDDEEDDSMRNEDYRTPEQSRTSLNIAGIKKRKKAPVEPEPTKRSMMTLDPTKIQDLLV